MREDDTLSGEAKSAQKAEMERRLRLQLEQRAQVPHSSASDIWTPMTNIPVGEVTSSPSSSDGKHI